METPPSGARFSAGAYRPMSVYVRPASERLLRALADSFRHGGDDERVLFDIGCGDGNLALAAAARGWTATGIDLSESQVSAARARAASARLADRVTFRMEPEEATSLPRGGADAVGSAFGIVFAADPVAALARMTSLARPGGSVGLTTWMPYAASAVLRRVLRTHAQGERAPDLPAPWAGERDLARDLRDAGVEDIRVADAALETAGSSLSDVLVAMTGRAPVLAPLLAAAGERLGRERVERACREALEVTGSIGFRASEVVVRDRYLVAAGRRR